MTRQIAAAVVAVVALTAGCSSGIQEQAEELFRACIEQGGGTTGDLSPTMEGGQLVAMSGPVDASGDLVAQCFDATNAELADS